MVYAVLTVLGFLATAAVFYLVGHMVGYKDGHAAMIAELNKLMDDARAETEETKRKLEEVEKEIGMVSEDLKNF